MKPELPAEFIDMKRDLAAAMRSLRKALDVTPLIENQTEEKWAEWADEMSRLSDGQFRSPALQKLHDGDLVSPELSKFSGGDLMRVDVILMLRKVRAMIDELDRRLGGDSGRG